MIEHECPFCGDLFSEQSNLLRCVRNHFKHGILNDPRYKSGRTSHCEVCSTYIDVADISEHAAWHVKNLTTDILRLHRRYNMEALSSDDLNRELEKLKPVSSPSLDWDDLLQ